MTSILIVDDAAFARRMIRKFLQVDGYEIIEAANGNEGLEKARTHTPDLILTDLLMPDINGFDFLQKLQESDINIPTIIISADIQETSRTLGLSLGAIDFINKPPKQEEVLKMIKKVLNK